MPIVFSDEIDRLLETVVLMLNVQLSYPHRKIVRIRSDFDVKIPTSKWGWVWVLNTCMIYTTGFRTTYNYRALKSVELHAMMF